MPLYFTGNPLLICKIRIAIKVSRLNALTQNCLILFCLQKSLGSAYFPKEYLFARKKRLPGAFISWEITTGEQHVFTLTQELLSDSNGIQTSNHLVLKRTLNHLAKLANYRVQITLKLKQDMIITYRQEVFSSRRNQVV